MRMHISMTVDEVVTALQPHMVPYERGGQERIRIRTHGDQALLTGPTPRDKLLVGGVLGQALLDSWPRNPNTAEFESASPEEVLEVVAGPYRAREALRCARHAIAREARLARVQDTWNEMLESGAAFRYLVPLVGIRRAGTEKAAESDEGLEELLGEMRAYVQEHDANP